jgi:hypothetical protein
MWEVGLFVALRLAPAVINTSRTGYFMESFTVLDQDRVEFKAANSDLFMAIQPHHMMGNVYTSVFRADGSADTIRHRVGDRFYVENQDLILQYSYRGGGVVNTWQLPRGFCKAHNVFSTHQREAVIAVHDDFSEPVTICWLLNFMTSVNFSVTFAKGSNTSRLRIGDNSSFAARFHEVGAGESLSGQLDRQQVIVLDAAAGHHDIVISIHSNIPFGDWTDSPSIFRPRGSDVSPALPMYIVTYRDVKQWICVLLFGIVASALLYTAFILFMSPEKDADLTEAQKQAVVAFMSKKAKTE